MLRQSLSSEPQFACFRVAGVFQKTPQRVLKHLVFVSQIKIHRSAPHLYFGDDPALNFIGAAKYRDFAIIEVLRGNGSSIMWIW